MKRYWLGIAAVAVLSACSGGNPFEEDPDVPVVPIDPVPGIPDDLTADLDSVAYNPNTDTLIVTGVSLDNTPIDAIYTRAAGLDRDGYQAYTTQDASLQRHSTAYYRELDGVEAVVVATGGQFGYYFRGSTYSRSGDFDPPSVARENGLVSYAGRYIGLRNTAGSGEDLLPVTPGTPGEILPAQIAEVTGDVFINADFADYTVNGVVYNRVSDTPSGTLVSVRDLQLAPTSIAADGSFIGDVEQDLQDRGTYGGIFGGTDASAVAGTLFAQDHIEGSDNPAEHGAFVLAQCGTPTADPVCDQPVP